MTSQTTLIPKKRRGPAPTGQGKPVMVRLHSDDLASVDQWAKDQPDHPTRPEAIRRLIKRALSTR